ncbi:MAG TPA: DUF4148 domain-containing protein [Ramlibacter sp.]|nr:DUF4148 domain-containing protein [Ramlibacter sp.]
MKRTSLFLAGFLSLAAFTAQAESPDPSGQFAVSVRSGKTRAAVLAELKEAQRTGDILAAGEGGTRYDLNPGAYPARMQVAGKTREQVREETLQALRDGDVPSGELGLTQREAFPERYMARGDAASRQRMAGMSQVPAQR